MTTTLTLQRMTRIARWICRGLLVEMVLVGAYALIVVHAQDPYRLEQRINEIDKDLSGRIRVLESDMVEIKWMARGVAIAIVGQLVLTIFTLRDHRALPSHGKG